MRINLYFPDDHIIAQIPKGERTKQVKTLIEFALIHKKRVEYLENEIKTLTQTVLEQSNKLDQIINLLSGVNIKEKEEIKTNNLVGLSESDYTLIDQMLNIKK